jgi:hypothetical protein
VDSNGRYSGREAPSCVFRDAWLRIDIAPEGAPRDHPNPSLRASARFESRARPATPALERERVHFRLEAGDGDEEVFENRAAAVPRRSTSSSRRAGRVAESA